MNQALESSQLCIPFAFILMRAMGNASRIWNVHLHRHKRRNSTECTYRVVKDQAAQTYTHQFASPWKAKKVMYENNALAFLF